MSMEPKKVETANKPEKFVTFSPQKDKFGVMKISNLLKPRKFINKCKRCRIANLCLPAKLNKSQLKTYDQLRFKSRTLIPGEILCHQGERQDHLYAIRSGVLKSFTTQSDGKDIVMAFHLPPDIFGWEGIDEEHRSTTIVALEYCNVCEIPLQQWEQLTIEIPGLSLQLLQLVSQKFHLDNQKMLKTLVEQRVANFLLRLMSFYRRLGYPHYLCKLPMSYRDIANYLRIAPETITRTFKLLQKKEIIRLSRSSKHKLYIKNFDRLRSVANQS